MTNAPIARRAGLLLPPVLLAAITLLALPSPAVRASSYGAGCAHVPIVYGIPPWGFHTGPPIGDTGSFARGHGQMNLAANTVSGSCARKTAPAAGPPVRSR